MKQRAKTFGMVQHDPEGIHQQPKGRISMENQIEKAAREVVKRWEKYSADDGTMGDLRQLGLAVGDLRASLSGLPQEPAAGTGVNLDIIKDRLDHIIMRCDQYGYDNIVRGLAIEAIQHITSRSTEGDGNA